MKKEDQKQTMQIVCAGIEQTVMPVLGDITKKLDEHTEILKDHTERLESIERKLDSTIERVDKHDLILSNNQ